MTQVPEGVQLSEDGQWWWDGQDWQPVPQDGDRAAARVAQGLPASAEELTDEHRAAYLGEPTVEVEAVEADEVDVLAMDDAGSGGGSLA